MTLLGTAIKEKRKRKGWSQTVLGDLVGMSAATIHRIEHSEKLPTDSELERFAEALGLELSQLLQFVEEDNQKPRQDIVPETSYTTQWEYAHPADYSGRVWIQIYPKSATDTLDVHIRWSAWQYQDTHALKDRTSLILWHYKFNDGQGIPMAVTLSQPCYVVFGKDTPPDKPIIDIIHQWQRIQPMSLTQTIRFVGDFIRTYLRWHLIDRHHTQK